MKIWANVLTRNEERYLWFSVKSVVDHVDKVLIWDDGSVDDSPKIIKELSKTYPTKIIYKLLKQGSSPEEYPKLRQKMLEESRCDWVILVDADEIWWEDSIKKLVALISQRGSGLDSMVTSYKNVIGDIFHYQPEEAGMYKIDGKRGHLSIRAMNTKVSGLHFDKPHGQLCIIDKDATLLQNRDRRRRVHAGLGYLHFTNMVRSRSKNIDIQTPKRSFKYKYELGKSFSRDYFYPEVLFEDTPNFILSPWEKMTHKYYFKAILQTPFKKIKRKYIHKVGY